MDFVAEVIGKTAVQVVNKKALERALFYCRRISDLWRSIDSPFGR
ncbi:hypothetical protein CAter282_0886 [Collimonas arenae]|uniref:Uncharacterized protein n=1 Tax=Collimonas arenae TaxID=279058 RepID=A0A127PN04_9BURK|nr:hypothetical protein CAter10_0959 [Collimonas arenae]AMP08686.1 hypothetical protein CAter282_0886 [Collimonas arenae]